MTILHQILAEKEIEVAALKEKQSIDELRALASAHAPAPAFAAALKNSSAPAIISEIKRGSPSKGAIRPDLSARDTAIAYAEAGAAAISVLTDEKFFSGSLDDLKEVRSALNEAGFTSTPLLRKEFIIDPYQIWEARVAGASAILLIVAALDKQALSELCLCARAASLDVLIEVHNTEELSSCLEVLSAEEFAKHCENFAIGINNRDLKTFITELSVTKHVSQFLQKQISAQSIPSWISKLPLVAESGIFTASDLVTLRSYGATAYLIGESLVRTGDPKENLLKLIKDYNT